MRTIIAIVIACIALSLPASASAEVLISPPQGKRICTCNGVRYGYWYQDHSGGSRYVTVKVWRGSSLVRKRRYRAGDEWQYDYFNTQRPGGYRFQFVFANGRSLSYPVTFFHEDH